MNKFRYILRYYIDPGYEEDTRIDELVNFCNEASVDEVMLFFNAEELNDGHAAKESLIPWLAMAEKLQRKLTENGVGLSVNPWTTTVHSPRGRKLKTGQDFTLMVGENGKNNGVTTCPMCEKWLEYICDLWAMVAEKLHPAAIWVEDDWRLGNHGRIMAGGGCFCEKQISAFSAAVGRKVDREELISKVYGAGKVHPWRKIWLDINRKAMTGPLRAIRRAIQQVSPETRLGIMCGTVDTVSREGGQWHEIQDAAGFDPAFLVRPTLYPYTEIWPMLQFPVPARLITAALKRPLEICPELETGPRHGAYSKGNTFSGWELEQCAAIGAHCITINHFDMLGCGTSTAPGFAKMLRKKRPRLDAVRALNLDDDNSIGANILFSGKVAQFLQMEKGGEVRHLSNYSDEWGRVGAILGFTFRFTDRIENSDQAILVSGQTLNAFSDEDVKKVLSNGVILDAFAAKSLIDRGFGEWLGVDFKAEHFHNVSAYSYEEIPEDDPTVYGVKNPRMTIQRACRRLYEFTACSAAVEELSNIRKYDRTRMFGGVFFFRNSLGGRVITLSYPLGECGDSEWFYMGFFNPFRRIFMHKILHLAAEKMAIACAEEHPFQMHRVAYEHGEFFAAVNAVSDPAEQVVLAVTDFPKGKIEVLDEQGNWLDDGKFTVEKKEGNLSKVVRNSTVPPLGTLFFRVEREKRG